MAATISPAAADGFYNRVGAGNLVFATAEGARYAQAYAPLVSKAVQACVPSSPAGTESFIYVASVTKTGAQHNGAVRPGSVLAQCFAARFSQNRLPPPPLPSYAKIDYPLVIEVNLTP